VIYRSWRVDAARSLNPPALWPCELIVAVIEVTVVKEVVIDADEMAQSPRVTEPGEVGVGPTAVVLVGAGTRSCLGGREYFHDSLHRFALGTSWAIVLEGPPLIRAQAKVGQGLRDGVDVDGRGKKDQVIVHSCADEI
jgi:hypothetical protein